MLTQTQNTAIPTSNYHKRLPSLTYKQNTIGLVCPLYRGQEIVRKS